MTMRGAPVGRLRSGTQEVMRAVARRSCPLLWHLRYQARPHAQSAKQIVECAELFNGPMVCCHAYGHFMLIVRPYHTRDLCPVMHNDTLFLSGNLRQRIAYESASTFSD